MLVLVSEPSGGDNLIAALERTLDALRSSGGEPAHEERPPVDDVSSLVIDFDSLAGTERDLAAHALTQLLDAFTDRFGGLQGFLSAGYCERREYLDQLERASARMSRCSYGGSGHYYRATALLLSFLRSTLQQHSLGSRLLEALHRGRALSLEGPGVLRHNYPAIAAE
jgi:hypothetical protein